MAVTIPVATNTVVATMDRRENRLTPHKPCPEVHPLPSCVPKPTSKPPKTNSGIEAGTLPNAGDPRRAKPESRSPSRNASANPLRRGGGLKGGIVHGATDEIGFHATENRHYVTDVHATILHQLGLDSRKLEIPGRKRLDVDHGAPIKEIIS